MQENQPKQVWHHHEKIVCPSCQSVEVAIVKHTFPWWSYIHNCSKCGYTIMESEWDEVDEGRDRTLALKVGQKVWIKSIAAYGEVRKFVGNQVNIYVGEGRGDALFEWDDLTWEGLENV